MTDTSAPERITTRRALVSVYDKTGLEELGRALHEAGVEIVSTGSTAARLAAAGVPVVAVTPGSDRYVIGPVRGHYVAQWRTFLGAKVTPSQLVEMAARLTHGQSGVGGTDAGAPDGG